MSPGDELISSVVLKGVTIDKCMSHLPGMLITIVLRNDPDEHHR